MKADTTVTISSALIEEWETKAAELEQAASKMLAEAKAFRARVEAGTLLLGPVGGHSKVEEGAAVDTESMIEAMATVANMADRPLTKSAMRSRLMTLGFPEDRMGNYFYTCVARLKGKKRISVLPDGRISKAPA
jgi:hypothetical protein